ncbi:hypothetical protein J2Y03_003920 [Neobacillus niacini]|uniref:Ig-like domain-containing protein n=1 Tax=Neobacillus niacini TaxID=86668 RepID=UPI00285C0A97|nr:Ig-like domain-containing protein [Neobacillus niacini]MDR7078863.1 hypothetical protein [Neobacillus niacini]
MKNLRNVFCLLFICLIALPISAHGQENATVAKSLISKITTSTSPGGFPKKSLSVNQSYSPADYPLKTAGSYVDYLYDSWYSYHYITFETVSSYSSTDLNVQILYDSDYSYSKDSIINVEFLKNNGGTLEYIDATEFDTYGFTNLRLNSLGSKSLFQNQQYIYIRVGVSEYASDYYYSDVIQFKVVNPFYTPPVVDKTAPAKPTVYTVSNITTSVKGKAEPFSTLIIKSGTTTIGTGTVLSDGTYSVAVPKLTAGAKISVYAKDNAGNTSTPTTVTVIDKSPPAKPTINSVGDNQTIITGKAEAGSKVTIKQGSTTLGQSTATSTGYFTIKMTAAKKAGTSLTADATDAAGNKSSYTYVTVVDKTPPVAPTVNKVTYTSTTVSGKAEKFSTVYIFKGTTLVGKTTTDSYGNFKASIKTQAQGSSLEIISMDKAWNQSKSTWAKVY